MRPNSSIWGNKQLVFVGSVQHVTDEGVKHFVGSEVATLYRESMVWDGAWYYLFILPANGLIENAQGLCAVLWSADLRELASSGQTCAQTRPSAATNDWFCCQGLVLSVHFARKRLDTECPRAVRSVMVCRSLKACQDEANRRPDSFICE